MVLMIANLPSSEKLRIHTLLQKLQPLPSSSQDQSTSNPYIDEPYPFLIFLFRQIGLILRTLSPHIQSFLVRLLEFEQKYNLARGCLEWGMGMVERSVDVAVKLGVGDAVVGFSTALGRGVGETYRVYKGM
jgi:hypothetical protein